VVLVLAVVSFVHATTLSSLPEDSPDLHPVTILLEDGTQQQSPLFSTDFVTAHEIDMDEYNNILEQQQEEEMQRDNEAAEDMAEIEVVQDNEEENQNEAENENEMDNEYSDESNLLERRYRRENTRIPYQRNHHGGSFRPLTHYRPAGMARGLDYWSEMYQHDVGGTLIAPPKRAVKIAILGKNTPPVKMSQDDAKTYFHNLDELLASEALGGEEALRKKAEELGYPGGSLSGEYYQRVKSKLSKGLLLNKAGTLDRSLYPIPPPSTFQRPLEGYKIGFEAEYPENFPNGAAHDGEVLPAFRGRYGFARP